jgi:hypothetical protein
MSGKGSVCIDEGPENKKKRKVLSVFKKLEVMNKLDRVMSIGAVICISSEEKTSGVTLSSPVF